MVDPKQDIIDWLNSGGDYDQGVALYSRFGKNRNMARLFPGKINRMELKLRYELCKSVGLDWKNIPQSLQCSPVVSSKEEKQESGMDILQDPGDQSQYPVIIRRIIHEYSEEYRLRSQLHFRMGNVPENNSPDNVALRKELFSRIRELSARMEQLFQAKENYFWNKILPDPDALWPPDQQVQEVRDKPLPDDPAELRRLKKNLQTYNVKDNNLLLYQSVIVKPDKHPMPAGPRRMGIEKRIRSRLKLIEKIDYKLVEHAG